MEIIRGVLNVAVVVVVVVVVDPVVDASVYWYPPDNFHLPHLFTSFSLSLSLYLFLSFPRWKKGR